LLEKLHYPWFEELFRVLNKGGFLILTTQGENFKNKMTVTELEHYNNNELVVRGNVLEGHRTYSAFHPIAFMKKLFQKAELLEHVVIPPTKDWNPQDIWIVKKK